MSSDEERLWWSILLDAEVLSWSASRQVGGGALAVRYMKVAIKARTTLRDKFGVNLDDLGIKARERVDEMEKAEEQKECAEKLLFEQIDKFLDETKEIFKK